MSPAAIVAAVTRLGVELRVIDGDRVQLRPVAAVPDDLRAAIRQHRHEVAAYLRRAEDARLGPWQPPGRVAPPRQCVACGGGLQPGDPDGAVCSTCIAWFEISAPRRPQ